MFITVYDICSKGIAPVVSRTKNWHVAQLLMEKCNEFYFRVEFHPPGQGPLVAMKYLDNSMLTNICPPPAPTVIPALRRHCD